VEQSDHEEARAEPCLGEMHISEVRRKLLAQTRVRRELEKDI
jgi:hypothetical protein